MRVQSLNSLTARRPPIAVQFLNVSSPCSRIGMRAIPMNLVPRSRLTFCPELARRLLQTIGADSTDKMSLERYHLRVASIGSSRRD